MDLREFDLNLLLVFNQLFQERRVQRVAETLKISQSGVSNALNRLRNLLNDELFVRTAHGMEPTSYAMELANPIAEALTRIQDALDFRTPFDPMTSTRQFTIAMTDIGEIDFLPGLMEALGTIAPLVTLNTVRNNALDLRAAMEKGEVDLAVGLLPDLETNFFKRHLTMSEYVCLFRQGHPLDKSSITIDEFVVADHLVVVSAGTGHSVVDEEFGRRNIRRKVKLQIPHFAAVGYLLHDTDLITTVPRRLVRRCSGPFKLTSVPVPFVLPPIHLNLFWSARFHRDLGNQWLRNLMVDTFNTEEAAFLEQEARTHHAPATGPQG